MKTKITSVKALLISALMFGQFGAFAQQKLQKQKLQPVSSKSLPDNKQTLKTQKAFLQNAKNFNKKANITATPTKKPAIIWSEDFAGGIPPGWANVANVGADMWIYSTTGPQGAFPIGPINSTTTANGYMLFDSDLLCSGNQDASFITSAIDLSLNPNVVLEFEQYYAKWMSSTTIVSVSNDSTVWTDYIINTGMADNDLTLNPDFISIDISAVAGSQLTVYLKFTYQSTASGCDYSWMVDDISISDLVPFDAAITYENLKYTWIPIKHANPLNLEATISNLGINAVTNVLLTVNLYDTSFTNFFTGTSSTVASLAPGLDTNLTVSYTPAGGEIFYAEYIVSITEADANTSNDTMLSYQWSFISDTIYARDDGIGAGALWAGAGNPYIFGQTYSLQTPDDLNSITGWPSGNVLDTMRLVVYDMVAGLPNTLVGFSSQYIFTPADTPNVVLTLPISGGPLNLAAGDYFVGIQAYNTTGNIATVYSDNIFTPGVKFASVDGGASFFSLGNPLSLIIRPNFAPVLLLSAAITDSADATCNKANGPCDGWAVVTATGGTSPYTYLWSDAQTTDSAVGLCAGAHTVWVWDAAGDSVSAMVTIIEPAPYVVNVIASGPITLCAGDSVELVSDTATSYDWLMNGATTGTTGINYYAASSGNYQVVATDTSGCVDTSAVDTVVVNPLPVVSVTPSPGTYCAPLDTVMLTASGAATYAWAPNYEINDTTLTTVVILPTADTVYTVIGTDANGCTDTTTVAVQLSVAVPVASFTADTTSVCEGSSVIMNNTTTGSFTGFLWVFQGGTPDSSTTQNPVVTYDTAGTYNVTLTAYGCGASDSTITKTGYITVNPVPTANITPGGPTTFCAGDSVDLVSDTVGITNYDWLLNSVSTTTTDTTYNASVGGDYQVVVWTAFGCYDTSAVTTVTVNLLPVISVTPSPGVVCGTGDSVMLTASGAVSYAWSPPTDLSATTGDIVYANPTINTTYTVVGTDAVGCIDSTMVDVMISAAGAVALFTADVTSGCGSVTVTFDGSTSTNAIGYSWLFPGGTPDTSNLQNPVVTYDTVGVWNVTLTAFGCGGLDSIIIMSGYITVDSLPTVTFTALANVCDTITALALTGGSPAAGTYSGPNVNGGNFDAQAAGVGTHTITYTYTDGVTGCKDSATQSINVVSCPVGVMELINAANSINLYPNPTTGILNLDVDADMKVTSIKIYSIIGSLVYEITHGIELTKDHYVIDLSGEPRGAYLVRIQTANQVLVKKVNLNN
ncbi:MAG: T9SS type A sorting domain-containing protein [Cytophagales bacterium]|nr:T9SS type A sorting domain-containing protein [Cytophagales bacterium]